MAANGETGWPPLGRNRWPLTLDELIETRSLPPGARGRIRDRLEVLEAFPRIGRRLQGRWQSYRVLLGPWRWMLFVYLVLDEEDRVLVVTVQDARTGDAVTSER